MVAERMGGLMKAVPHLGTQMKLANKTGIGQTTIGRIRRGEVNATSENMRSIADAFGVTVGYLYGEEAAAGKPVEAAKNRAAVLAEKYSTAAPRSDMPATSYSVWPFSVSRKQFDQLPKSQKDKVNDFIEYTAARWQETHPFKGKKNS